MTNKPSVAERIDTLTTERRGISAPAFFGLAITVALMVGFNAWSYRESQRNAVAASKAQCQVSHLSRGAIVGEINRNNAPVLIPEDASPEFRAELERKNRDNETYREKALEPLRQLSCRELGDVPAPSPQPLVLPPVPLPVPPPIGLRGPAGPSGTAGKDGKNGIDGRAGHDGKDGAPGAVVIVPAPTPSPTPAPIPDALPLPEPSPTPSEPVLPILPTCLLGCPTP
jgi:hypothetical protein